MGNITRSAAVSASSWFQPSPAALAFRYPWDFIGRADGRTVRQQWPPPCLIESAIKGFVRPARSERGKTWVALLGLKNGVGFLPSISPFSFQFPSPVCYCRTILQFTFSASSFPDPKLCFARSCNWVDEKHEDRPNSAVQWLAYIQEVSVSTSASSPAILGTFLISLHVYKILRYLRSVMAAFFRLGLILNKV